MTAIIPHLASLSVKVALLGGVAWLQLYLLRRAPAASRSRLCSLALVAILLLAGAEVWNPGWVVNAPVYGFSIPAVSGASPAARLAPGYWLMFAWIAGAAILLSRVMVGRVALAILRRRSILVERVAGVDVRMAAVQTPVLAGLAHPVVLLPEASAQWTEEQRRMVLIHELNHFSQGDGWTNLLAQILRAAFWFHPVVWLLVSRLSREQELTCDEAVLASGHSRHEYAAFLLDTVRNLRSGEMFACSMTGSGARSLKQRFANLLESAPRPVLTRRVTVCLVVFLAAAAGLMVIRPVLSRGPVFAQQRTAGPQEEVYRVGAGVTHPMLLSKVEPGYTEAARAAKISGTCRLKLIVTPEGKAENIEVTDGVGYGLDEKAIDAISQWTFQPATKDGAPVAVWATVEVNFRLL